MLFQIHIGLDNAVYSFVKSHFISSFVSAFTLGKDMKVTTENLPAKRVSRQKTIQKITCTKAGVSESSLTRPIIEVYFELHVRLLSGGFLLKLAMDGPFRERKSI